MTPEAFSDCIWREVVEENWEYYKAMLDGKCERGKGGVWDNLNASFATMDAKQQDSMLQIARLAMIDTASNILGIIDGSTLLENYREEFVLHYGNDDTRLNGDLQDYFLASLE